MVQYKLKVQHGEYEQVKWGGGGRVLPDPLLTVKLQYGHLHVVTLRVIKVPAL